MSVRTVKIFVGYPKEVEKEIDQWVAQNEENGIEIISTSQSTHPVSGEIVLTVLYHLNDDV
jgi:hypothetical protein